MREDLIESLRKLIDDRCGDGPSGPNYDPELLDVLTEAAAALEAAREDAEKWRRCNATYDLGEGQRIECHVIVGVNVWEGEEWLGFEQPEPDDFFKVLEAIDQARGKENGND